VKQLMTKRILMLLENNPYPQDGRVRREALALAAAGYRVTVIAPADKGQSRRETVNGVSVYRYPPPPAGNGLWGYLVEYGWSLLATFALTLVVLVRGGFDVIHAHNPPDLFVLIALLYKMVGKRFVFDHHDLSPEMYDARFHGDGSRLVKRALIAFERLSCRAANHVIATNQSYRALEIDRDGVSPDRITIVRNGPELNLLRIAEPDPQLAASNKAIIGYVGVMGVQDGADYLIRALGHLRHDLRRTDFQCVLVGDGEALSDLKAQVQQLDLADQAMFTGWVDSRAVARYLAAMDICAAPEPSNPYNDRSTVIKITEYMALGKPIVAFDLPEHRFTAQGAALYVTPNDERAFAEALARLLDDAALRQTLGAAGRQRIETELAWQYCVPNLLTAYQKLWPVATSPRLSTQR
jgi:glycosyltransferase involved in cell wall biosynthesis